MNKNISHSQQYLAPPPKVAAVHDVSCVGRCAQTVIMPVLSAMGVQVCPLPTALLSTHTGGYTNFTFLDLSNEMTKIIAHFKRLGTVFDSVYSGFLGSAEQINTVLGFATYCKEINPGCIFLADPVMGDDGCKYATYTDEMCMLTRKLITKADIITPNLTEACILLDKPYKDSFSDDEISGMLSGLCEMGAKNIIITGIHRADKVGAVFMCDNGSLCGEYFAKRDPNNYPGAGDIFSSIILACAHKKMHLYDAVKLACDFISEASSLTSSFGTPVKEGLAFEGLLGKLILN